MMTVGRTGGLWLLALGSASLTLAACGQGDSGNVMADSPNALSPEQVDAALGPELDNEANALPPEGNAAEAEGVAADVEESAAPAEPRNPAPAEEPEPESEANNVEEPE
jgi:hypothetical protein